MNEPQNTPTNDIILHPQYQTAHAQITEPTRFVAMSHYYRRRWLRHVGPVGTAILLELRGRCYNNPATGEKRDTVMAAQKELAESIGISVDTLQRQLGKPGQDDDPKANGDLRRFVWTEERYERGGAGRVRQLENVYHVSMDDPVHPDDEERLEILVQEYERQAQETDARHRQNRKLILPAPDAPLSKTSGAPEPQIAALREKASDGAAPEPQIAVGGHRKLRQGLPQNAAPSKDSLLLITKEITDSTLNVGEGLFDFVSSGDDTWTPEGHSPPSLERPRNVLDGGLDTQMGLIVQELKDWGSERRHKQLLAICERHGLSHLPGQALQATRQRLARETRRGVLEKPGAYYQRVLVSLLEGHQVFVPTMGEEDADEVKRLARASLGLSQDMSSQSEG